jgi:hypothetical protein
MSDNGKYWFPAKRYGWGWGPPVSWQGWVFMLCWLAGFFVGAARWRAQHELFALFVAAMVALMLLVCYLKGEPPKWRWGKAPD